MNILFLTQFYWPEIRTAPLNLAALAEDLAARGHRVTVITAVPSHPFGRVYEGYRMKLHQWEEVRGVQVLRLPLFPDHSLSSFKRALNYSSFALSAALLGRFCTRKIAADVIFSYLPPLTIGFPAALLSRSKGAPIVYWMTDLWPENLVAAGAKISPRMYKRIRRLEDWVYRKSTTICVNSPGYITNLKEKGVDPSKIKLLTDWADEKLFFSAPYEKPLAEELGLAGKFNILYGGNLGKVQGLDVVIEAARLIEDTPDLQFVFIGDGTESERLKKLAAGYRLKNVLFIPRVPPEEIHRYFALADVLLAHLENKPVFKMQIPSKIIAYMACGKPVLCGIAGESAKIVQDARGGNSFVPQDARSLAEQARIFYNMPREELEQMGQRGREAYLAGYTRHIQVERIEKILQGGCGAPSL
ncbi:MAG: glycosyltransferase family 4 protein [Candidatus Aminicenantes bacterium]|nr:glycosyltransferase family 4 protein [Candidatus Aminicenantes bacterium]